MAAPSSDWRRRPFPKFWHLTRRMNAPRVVCALCRESPKRVRLGLWLCRDHWRLVVRLARLMPPALVRTTELGALVKRIDALGLPE